MSLSPSRTFPPEIAESEALVALVERGREQGHINGDDVRMAFEAGRIPVDQWKRVLRSLNQVLDEEGVALHVSAAPAAKTAAKKPRKAAAATTRSVAKKTTPTAAPRPIGVRSAKATAAAAAAAAAAPAAAISAQPQAPAAEGTAVADPAAEPKKRTVKKAAAKKTVAAKKTAAKKTTAKDADPAAEEINLEGEDWAAEITGGAAEEPEEDESKAGGAGFVLSDEDDDDAPAQTVMVAGATADPVKDYLKLIGKVPLLNAEQEVELAKRIEAGLFSEFILDEDEANELERGYKRELEILVEDGKRAKNHLLEANLRLVVSLAKRYTGRGMLFLDLIQSASPCTWSRSSTSSPACSARCSRTWAASPPRRSWARSST